MNARAGRRLAELADEWDEIGPQVESALADGALPAQAVFDQVTHEHDLRSAVGRPGAQSHPAVPIGLSFVVDAWPFVASSLDVPPLRIVAGDATMVVGDPAAQHEFLERYPARTASELARGSAPRRRSEPARQ